MLAKYTAMLQFYSTSDAARRGSLSSFNDADCIVFEKTLNDKKILVIINSRASGKNLSVPNSLQGNWENALANQPVALTGNMQLNGHEYLILKN